LYIHHTEEEHILFHHDPIVWLDNDVDFCQNKCGS